MVPMARLNQAGELVWGHLIGFFSTDYGSSIVGPMHDSAALSSDEDRTFVLLG